jgi:hypothetical protein
MGLNQAKAMSDPAKSDSSGALFRPLSGWEGTRDTLHWYARAICVIPRALAIPHPKWWHISLKVQPDGLITDGFPLPGGGICALKIDLHDHTTRLITSRGEAQRFSMRRGLSARQFGAEIIAAVEDLGLRAEYACDRFADDTPRQYDPAHASNYFDTLVNIDHFFKLHRSSLTGEVGPVQLWSHHFDLSFEWFGTRLVENKVGEANQQIPAQLNLGFSPGDGSHPEPYFYSNPWPFEKSALIDQPLPHGARWFTGAWEGSLFPYAELVGDRQAGQRLLAYARAVFAASAPTLLA